jgi:hypothetical protein
LFEEGGESRSRETGKGRRIEKKRGDERRTREGDRRMNFLKNLGLDSPCLSIGE